MLTIPLLGRFYDGSTERDFSDGRLRRLRAGVFQALERLRRLVGRPQASTLGFSLNAQMRLRAAYLHYWPKPITVQVDILCSARREKHYEKNGFWARVLPNRVVTVVGVKHSEVIAASSEIVAAELGRILDSPTQEGGAVAAGATEAIAALA
jgi:hypothetical protein